MSISGARNRVFKEPSEACRHPSRHLEKHRVLKSYRTVYIIWFWCCVFFFNSTCWDWETGNKILLNAMRSGITFFSLFPIRSYVFQNICHKLAIFITQFFESIWSRGEDFSFHYCWSEAYIIWILEYLVMRMIPPNKFVLYPRDKLCLLYINISFNEPYCKLFAFTVSKSPLCFNSSFLGQT